MASQAIRRIAMCLGVVVVSAVLCACATLGGIPASTFQFYNVVPHAGPSEGGGVPERNHLGSVPDADAQETAATAADEAAFHVLRVMKPKPATSADLCLAFRVEMQRRMNLLIPGAKVDRFLRQGIPRTTFASSVQE